MLRLHHAPNTRSGRIVWLLEELGLPYELNRLDFHPSALKAPEHRARHPLGRVPVLDDGEVRLFESGAIVEYVLARHGGGRLRPPVDDPRFPAYLQWLHYAEGMVMPPVNTIMVETMFLPPERQNPESRARAEKLLKKAVAPLEAVLADQPFLVGEALSGADIMLGHAVVVAARLGAVDDEQPHLQAYVDRVAARPAFQTAMAA